MSSNEPSRKADDDDEAAGGPIGEDDKESQQQVEAAVPTKEEPQPTEGEDAEGNQPSSGAPQAPAQSAPANAVARYPPPPAGAFYPAPYPTNADGTPMYPPPRGYENAPAYVPGHPMPPYGAQMPPHPYPMYHPYQHAMYPPPPYPPYAYGPRPYEQAQFPPAAGAPYPPGQQPPADAKSAAEESAQPAAAAAAPPEAAGEEKGEDGGPIVPGAVTARLKTYIKPRVPSTQDVMDRRSRKNAQSRARAAKLRDRIIEIQKKNPEERDEEERQIFEQFEARRQRKNDRSRERALEKKEEIDRILTRPDKKRSKIEKQFLDTALSAKKRKNEGDRLRRQRLKDLGLSSKGTGNKPGISARGPLPKEYHQIQNHRQQQSQGQRAGPNFGEIPVSPLPTMPHHHAIQSPGVFPSPGMMPNMAFPSPSQPPRHGAPQGAMETPGRNRPAEMHRGFQNFPPPQGYDHSSPANRPAEAASGNSRVEQRTNPDGSMSISIGRGAGGEPSFGGEARLQGSEDQGAVNMADVTHLLIYIDNGDESGDGKEKQTE